MTNYNKLKNNNTSQIGIFIVIAIIIILTVVFITYQSNNRDLDKIINSNSDIKNNQGELFPLKEAIDTCLENQLKNGLIISGLRGGLIYMDNEKYTYSTGVNHYNFNLLSNFNLNQNYLSQNLIHSQYGLFMPRFNDILEVEIKGENQTIYSHSINEDFKRFTLSSLHNCLNFEDLSDDYKISQNIFFGNLVKYNSDNTIESTPFDGKNGDKISYSIDGVIYYGTIKTNNPGQNVISYIDNNPFTSQTKFEDILVINLNNSVELDIIFEDDKVSVKLTYPITLEQNGKKIYFKETKISVRNRMKKLFELGKFLLSKKINNRSLDYTDSMSLSKVLKENTFYNGLDNTELDFNISISNDALDYKLKTISIIDNRYKLYSNPYVVNLGYENSAPILKLKSGTYEHLNLIISETGYFKTYLELTSQINLRQFLIDNQIFDNRKSYFISQNIVNDKYSFSLSKSGIMVFTGLQEGVYNFDIEVTDGEATTNYNFKINVGLTSNFETLSLEDGRIIFIENYDTGNSILKFINGPTTGKISTTPNLILMELKYLNIINFDGNTPPYYFDSLIISGNFTNNDFDVFKYGGKDTVLIPNSAYNMYEHAKSLQLYLFNNRNIEKTEQKLGSFVKDYTLKLNKIEDYDSKKHFIVDLSYNYGINKRVKTSFHYYNIQPKFNSLSTSSVSFNMSIYSSYSFEMGPSSDEDLDELEYIISSDLKGVNFNKDYGKGTFTPLGPGTYSFSAYVTDGELKTEPKTIIFSVVE